MKTCKVEGCNGKHKAKGYCDKHYQQYKKYGYILDRSRKDPNEIVEYDDHAEIVLYNKQHEEVGRALIDLEDIDKVKDRIWYMSNGYAKSNKSSLGNAIKLHRLIIDCPDDKVVDHINHNGLDNRKENLRICTQHQNCMNKSKRVNNTSGITGVSWDKESNKWKSQIAINNRKINLGRYSTKEEAIRVRQEAEIEYYGEYRNKDNEDVV